MRVYWGSERSGSTGRAAPEEPCMTTVTIDDELATRLRALRDGDDDFNRLVTEALAETVRR